MTRICVFIIILFLTAVKSFSNANAFFTQNYKKQMLYGAFKNSYNADLYLGMRASFILKTWTPNIMTAISTNANIINTYKTIIPNESVSGTSGNYTYGIGVDLGIYVANSRFRHEINFEWYGITSNAVEMSQNRVVLDQISRGYAVINGRTISSIGTYGNIYKIQYSIYYNFENVIDFLKTKWDVFIGLGAGPAIISGGTYVGSEITSSGDSSSKYTYNDNDVSMVNDAVKHRLSKTKGFGVSYQTKIGMIANISQSFAASVAFSFGGTSRPLLSTKLKSIDKPNGAKSHFEYHILFEIGILLKAFEFSV